MTEQQRGQVREATPNRPRASANKVAKRAARREVAAARIAAARRRQRWTRAAIAASVVVVALAVTALVIVFTRGDDSSPSDALDTKPVVTAGGATPTQLSVTTLVQGKGDPVKSGQTIKVNYVGVSFKTGEEFDSSWSRNEPAEFEIGTGKVIKGWDQGLVGVKVGSRVQLDIPSDLAYGDNGQVPGPLRFVVDILSAS